MRVWMIGGTGFIGPHAVNALCEAGCELVVFHRGRTSLPDALASKVRIIHGRRHDLEAFRQAFRDFSPDVLVDMIPFTREDAHSLADFLNTLDRPPRRLVLLSSMDVYLAYGRLNRTELGAYEGVLTESSALRETDLPHGRIYDKISVEQILTDVPVPEWVSLRLSSVYGPGDPKPFLAPFVARMQRGRPAVLLSEAYAAWRQTHLYVAHAGLAVARAVTGAFQDRCVINVADPWTYSMKDWLTEAGALMHWSGAVTPMPETYLPIHLREFLDYGQHWDVDTCFCRAHLGDIAEVDWRESLRRTLEWQLAQGGSSIPSEHVSAEDVALAQWDEAWSEGEI